MTTFTTSRVLPGFSGNVTCTLEDLFGANRQAETFNTALVRAVKDTRTRTYYQK